MPEKEVYIVGGPNGSGKTTFVKQFLPEYVNVKNFVNADDIAVGLSPLDYSAMNIRSGKLMLDRVGSGGHDIPEETIRRRYVRSRRNFWYNYRGLVDNWYLFDNSSKNPVIVANSIKDKLTILTPKYFDFYLASIGGK